MSWLLEHFWVGTELRETLQVALVKGPWIFLDEILAGSDEVGSESTFYLETH